MVNIVALVKAVPADLGVHISRRTGRPALEGAEMTLDPAGRLAVCTALEIVAAAGGRVVALSFDGVEDGVREALALGAEEGALVRRPPNTRAGSIRTAQVLKGALPHCGPFDVVVAGARSADQVAGEVAPALAQMLELPFLGFAERLDVRDGRAHTERKLRRGLGRYEAALPAVVSVTAGPQRFPTPHGVLAAFRKRLVTLDPPEVGVTLEDLEKPYAEVRAMATVREGRAREQETLEGSPEEAAKQLLRRLRSKGVLPP